ncbi:MAG: hypothetical protein L3J33_08570 [Rhodobacteraceae bacterium]|nr:hypothetical protein [Paracoccaceae bacterium]
MALLAAAWLIANNKFTKRMAQAETVWANIAATAKPAALTYSPELVADLPEIAQRYFNHSIAVGTPLSTTVELQMYGEFRLGEKDNYKRFDMQARQILSPPNEFVWIADMKSGPVRVNGSDSFSQGQGWVRFWMFRAIPLVQATGNPDLDRAGAARPLVEAVWVPASLLPQNGAQWEQLDMTRAKVSFGSENAQQEMILTINQQGRPVSVTTQRWSDVNPEKTYQYTSFGGTMQEETQFGGFTIPSLVHVGYHFGSDNYFPFFIGNISDAKFY